MSLPQEKPQKGTTQKWAILLLVASTAILGIGVSIGSISKNGTIDALTQQSVEMVKKADQLAEEKQAQQATISELQAKVADLTKQLDSTYTAVEVGSSVDFPVLRGMARDGDTLKSFAAREGVSVEVIRALNPWLKDEKTTLQNRQTLWIPKR